MGQECGWRHAQKRWSWEFEDFEKESVESWDWTVEAESGISAIGAESWDLYRWGMELDLGRWRCSWVFGSLPTEILNITLLVSKNKSQKLIKPFVPETTESACICVLYYSCDWDHYSCVFQHLPPHLKSMRTGFFSGTFQGKCRLGQVSLESQMSFNSSVHFPLWNYFMSVFAWREVGIISSFYKNKNHGVQHVKYPGRLNSLSD